MNRPEQDPSSETASGGRAATNPGALLAAKTAATFLGIGYLKPGPGTWGSLSALLLWLAVAAQLHPAPGTLAAATLAASLLALIVGIPAATLVERASAGTDPQHVVLDEVAGQWLALVPAALPSSRPVLHALAAFALFRLFDITKPPPARQLERLHGGAGIMLDDIAAGMYAALVLLLIGRWF